MKKLTYLAAVLLLTVLFCTKNVKAINGDNLPETISIFGERSSDSLVLLMAALMNDFPEYSDDEYRNRLKALSTEINYRLDPLVKERILARTESYRSSTEFIIGKSEMYFPIFEECLAKYNVPHHLKYLPIIESYLNPVAKSVASAVGLWQFIPSTGKIYGLDLNNYIDGRSDTYKASDAAANLLSFLFARYNDWALALAAYNCGPGRVDNAIRAAKSNDYWVVRNYLPRETQNYVPYFMAMVYVGEFYESHDLVPTEISSDLILTDTLHISGGLSMFDLAKELDLSVDTLKILNPAYRRNYIPQDPKGQIIVLPARIMAQIKGYQSALDRAKRIQKNNAIRAVRRISTEKELQWLCRAHRCSVEDILHWNELPDNYSPKEGDLIVIRKHRISQNPIIGKTTKQQIETISISSFKVTGIDTVNNRLCTTSVFSKPGKFNDGIACTPHIDQSVKASSRFRIQSSSCAARSVDVNSVPKAGSFDDIKSNNQASAYVPQIENRGIGLLPEEGNGTASDHLGEDVSFPIESSFSDNVEGSESIELQEGSSLIPTELLKKNQTIELPKQEIEQSSNNTEQLPERNRARNIRSSDNPKQD
jgi:membrane-bound lytic murein transglycosylase D